jgi:2-amino-4-hydroxy-6-hydroxymethyldihydropteridine diphosphokinase
MAHCLISFGANIGNPLKTILAAAEQLQHILCRSDQPFQLSRCFRTPPVGGPSGQPPFVNAVAALTTCCSPWEVWHAIRHVEHELGRERNQRWEARRIDLDILIYGEQRIWTPHLKIPHPRMCMRRFILLPAMDVAPKWIDPVTGWTIEQLAENVRHGAGNFVLIAEPTGSASITLAEAARRTGAAWNTPAERQPHNYSECAPPLQRVDHQSGRWISLVERSLTSNSKNPLAGLPDTKLVIVLAPTVTAEDVAWEDFHRHLVHRLNLQSLTTTDSIRTVESITKEPIFSGPRYLLAADDSDWAMQEMIAALEAMDCPVEPL